MRDRGTVGKTTSALRDRRRTLVARPWLDRFLAQQLGPLDLLCLALLVLGIVLWTGQ